MQQKIDNMTAEEWSNKAMIQGLLEDKKRLQR